MTTISVPSRELLVIERLAAALEKAASVDEIKETRDRAMAIELYTRKKEGGLAAAQAAGRVVTDATMMLAKLYAQEESAQREGLKRGPARGGRAPDGKLGKMAVEEASGIHRKELTRMRPVLEAPADVVRDAKRVIEARGEIVTPGALVREVTATSSASGYDSDEWYTPPEFLVHVRELLGAIDLDPASNAHAQKTVMAKRYYTKKDNGLSKPWSGRVFCNPPYSSGLIEPFTYKLIESECEAVYLVNNATDTTWFHELVSRYPVCLTRGRISFLTRDGQKFGNRQGQAVFYKGRQAKRFAEVFGAVGCVLVRAS